MRTGKRGSCSSAEVPRGRLAAAGCLVLSGALLLAGCRAEAMRPTAYSPPPASTAPTTTTSRVDLSRVVLAPVPGTTTTTLPAKRGQAAIVGRVLDQSGIPVGGTTVRATWYSSSSPTVVEAPSGPDGAYRLEGLQGGRWRVRAFGSGYATDRPETLFLGSTETRPTELRVVAVPALTVSVRLAPDPPVVGDEAALAVLVLAGAVDGEGRARWTPMPGETVQLSGTGWSFPPDALVTGGDGVAHWSIRCLAEGSGRLAVEVRGRPFPLSLPACLGSPTSMAQVEPTSPATTATEPSASTTTRPSTTTTTTTRPRDVTRPVG